MHIGRVQLLSCNVLSYDGGRDHVVLARVNKARDKFIEVKSFLCVKRIGLNVKGEVYKACVRSCKIHGGET